MKNFRGMNPASSEINQDPNGGIDIVNCDISTIGSIKMRKGWTLTTCVPPLPVATIDGVKDLSTAAGEALIIFCNGHIFRLIGNTLTDITGGLTVTAGYRWRGDQAADHVFMGNGKDQPVVVGLTGNAVSYSAYSIANSATPPIPVGITIATPPAYTWTHNGHGLVAGNQVKLVTTGTLPAPFAVGTIYYIVNPTTNDFQLAVTLGGAPIQYTTAGSGTFSYTQTGVDQTPSSWIAFPPIGFIVLNQLTAQRMWAWNSKTVFYSAIYEPWDYVAANNAGFIDISPGDGDSVVAVAGTYGYAAVMTQKRTILYQGTGPADLGVSHVLTVGCASPDGVVVVGDDTMFLSPYGPTTLQRTQYGTITGAQLVNQMIGFPVAPLMHDTASQDGWGKCVAYHDINARRVIWWLPEGDVPNQGFVYQYDVKSWTRFNGWSINCVTRTTGNQLIAGGISGQLMILNQGGDDNGVSIGAYYITAWFDKGEPERNMTCPFMEIWVRVSGVKLTLTAIWDYGDAVDSHDIVYDSSGGEWGVNASDLNENVKWWGVNQTDSDPTVGVWNNETFVRVRQDVYGIGRAVQFNFQMNGSGSCEILAYRPDLRSKGLL